MSTDTDPCPVGCGRALPAGMVMCRKCWTKVSKPLQRAVYSAWAARQAALGTGREKYAAAVTAHEAAKAAAIRAAS